MSDTIHLINKKTIAAPLEAVYDALIDYRNFDKWWPEKLKVHVSEMGDVGSFDIIFNPAPTVHIAWKLIKEERSRMLSYAYVKGPFTGEGIWKMHAADEEGKTNLSYSIYLKAQSRLFKMASKTPMFRKRHLADVDELMASLERYLIEAKKIQS